MKVNGCGNTGDPNFLLSCFPDFLFCIKEGGRDLKENQESRKA